LSKQELFQADISNSNLQRAVLNDALIKMSNLTGVNLRNANLKGARLIDADLSGADLTGAFVFGTSSWDVELKNAIQKNLIITPSGAPEIIVDNLELAHSVYLLLGERKKIADVINVIQDRAVLLLGRFTQERKQILDAVADRLRQLNLLPIIFDFDPIPNLDLTETIRILAGLSNFIIADITQPRSVPQEAQAIIPDFRKPFIFVIQEGEDAWSMAADFLGRHGVIGPIAYRDKAHLVANLEKLLARAKEKNKELADSRAINALRTISIDDL
jgi:hypothetical protein